MALSDDDRVALLVHIIEPVEHRLSRVRGRQAFDHQHLVVIRQALDQAKGLRRVTGIVVAVGGGDEGKLNFLVRDGHAARRVDLVQRNLRPPNARQAIGGVQASLAFHQADPDRSVSLESIAFAGKQS